MFYADRNIRPCTILGYTLTTFPKSLIQTRNNKKNLHRIASHKSRKDLAKLVKNLRTTGFLHSKETTEQNKERRKFATLKTTGKRTTLSFVYFSLFVSKVKPNTGRRTVIRSRYKIRVTA